MLAFADTKCEKQTQKRRGQDDQFCQHCGAATWKRHSGRSAHCVQPKDRWLLSSHGHMAVSICHFVLVLIRAVTDSSISVTQRCHLHRQAAARPAPQRTSISTNPLTARPKKRHQIGFHLTSGCNDIRLTTHSAPSTLDVAIRSLGFGFFDCHLCRLTTSHVRKGSRNIQMTRPLSLDALL